MSRLSGRLEIGIPVTTTHTHILPCWALIVLRHGELTDVRINILLSESIECFSLSPPAPEALLSTVLALKDERVPAQEKNAHWLVFCELPETIPGAEIVLSAADACGYWVLLYDPSVFDQGLAEKMACLLPSLVHVAESNPSCELRSLPWDVNLSCWEAWTPPTCLGELWPTIVSHSGNSNGAGICWAGAYVTSSQQLIAWANQLACQLLSHLQQHPSPVVLLAMHSSPTLVLCELAALCAGVPFAPVDPANPVSRTQAVMSQTGATLILTEATAQLCYPNDPSVRIVKVALDPALHCDLKASSRQEHVERSHAGHELDALMYYIFTSGSTGRPKTVVVSQRALCHYLSSRVAQQGLSSCSRVFLASASSFDPSVSDIFTSAVLGATLCLPPGPGYMELLSGLLQCMCATAVVATPVLWGSLDKPDSFPYLGLVALGGDMLPASLASNWSRRPNLTLLNTYGVTEATVYQTAHHCRASDPIPLLGASIPSVLLTVISTWDGLPVPSGCCGEVVLAGPQLANGYLEPLDHSPFSCPSWAHGQRVYRTGDLGVITTAGLRLHGRIDQQVKIRGFRVELGEIEAACSNGHAATAVALHAGRVVAYVVLPGGLMDGSVHVRALDASLAAQLQDQCSHALPVYMQPFAFIALPYLPISTHGKLDRKALPVPAARASYPQRKALSAMERVVGKVWSQVLDLPSVGPGDHFVELGGDSMAAFRAVKMLRIARGGNTPFDMRPEEIREHPCDRGNDTATANLLRRPKFDEYVQYLEEHFEQTDAQLQALQAEAGGTEEEEQEAAGGGDDEEWCVHAWEAACEGDAERCHEWCVDATTGEFREWCGKKQHPLWVAASKGHVEVASRLLQARAPPNGLYKRGRPCSSPLHISSSNQHLNIVQLLLDATAEVNAVNKRHANPLHAAAEAGAVAVLSRLLEARCAIDARDDNKQTALHAAARLGSTECDQILLDSGTRALEARDKWQRPPLLWAVMHGSLGVVQLLLDSRACPDLLVKASVHSRRTTAQFEAPIHAAARMHNDGEYACLKMLIEANADCSARDQMGRTALHVAAQSLPRVDGQLSTVGLRLLVATGIDLSVCDGQGHTAGFYARKAGLCDFELLGSSELEGCVSEELDGSQSESPSKEISVSSITPWGEEAYLVPRER